MLSFSPGRPTTMQAPRGASPDQICRDILVRVAREFDLDAAALSGATRGAPPVAFARQVAMYLAHVGFALGFETIGKVFGRDRTTVAHGCRVVEDGRDDAVLDRRLAALEQACRSEIAQRSTATALEWAR